MNMKQNSTLQVKKGLFLTILIISIALFSIGFILDIVSFVQLALSVYLSSGWPLYVSSVLDLILCVAFLFASVTMLLWMPDNEGGTLLFAAGLYVVICGAVSMISGLLMAVHYNEVSYAIPAIISLLQIGTGIMELVLRNRRMTAARIIGIISFCVFALNNLLTAIGYVVAGQALLSVFTFIAIAFDVVVIVALCLLRENLVNKPNDSYASDEFDLEDEEGALGTNPEK